MGCGCVPALVLVDLFRCVCGVWREKKESDVHLGVGVEQVPLFDIAEKQVTAESQPQ